MASKTVPLTPATSLEDYGWLVGEEGRSWLDEIGGQTRDLVRLTSRLRKQLSAARAHLLLEQAELRRRAKPKFALADRMFFTPIGLEQATDERVAAFKSARFPSAGPLLDFCCGVGGDLLQLAGRGPVTGIDRDPIAALLAEANLAAFEAAGIVRHTAAVMVGDVVDADLKEIAAWHIDPDRRPQGRRTTRVELHEPGAPVVDRLLAVCDAAAIKLAPAAELPERWEGAAELEWISRGGECRQLVVWFGPLARSVGLRRATVISRSEERGTRNAERKLAGRRQASGGRQPPGMHEAGSDLAFESRLAESRTAPGQGRGTEESCASEVEVRSIVGQPGIDIPAASKLGRYLAEPDAAVLAADLSGALATERKLAPIAPGSVYLTGDRQTTDPALAWFEIADVLPFDIKRLKSLLRQRGCSRLEIKKRGVPHDPAQVRRQLSVPGENEATVFITRLGDAVTAIVARRV